MYPAWIFYFRWRLIAVASWILKSLQSTGGTSLENSRHDNLRNRKKKCFWNKNLTFGLYIWLPNHRYLGKAALSKNKTKQKQIAEHLLQKTIAKTETLKLYSCVTIIDNWTDWAKHSLQASSPIGEVARGHAKAARERRREHEKAACNDLK